MKYRIVRLSKASGKKASFYTIFDVLAQNTFFERFIQENLTLHEGEIHEIINRLKVISEDEGARTYNFKFDQGKPGDGVCYLKYREKGQSLRLYCIWYGADLIILGGGGAKAEDLKAFQESPKLKQENYLLRKISELVTEKLRSGDLELNHEFEGNFNLYEEDETES